MSYGITTNIRDKSISRRTMNKFTLLALTSIFITSTTNITVCEEKKADLTPAIKKQEVVTDDKKKSADKEDQFVDFETAVNDKVKARGEGLNAKKKLALKADIAQEVLKDLVDAHDAIIVDFWGNGCPPCREITGHFDKIAQDGKFADIKILKVNIHNHQAFTGPFTIADKKHNGVTSIPTIFFVKKGKVVHDFRGSRGLDQLKNWITTHFELDKKQDVKKEEPVAKATITTAAAA